MGVIDRRTAICSRLTVVAVVACTAVAACASGHRGSVTARHSDISTSQSPCRGVDPWTGPAFRGCRALVSRWAPVRSVALSARPSRRVRSTCEQAARQVRIAVVCPPLVPTDGVIADPDLYGAEPMGSDFYLLTFNNGENRGHLHWIVGAGRGKTVQRYEFDPSIWDVPGRVQSLGQRRYGPWTLSFYRFPPHPSGGELGGHDLALTQVGGTTYFVSLHGRTHHDADAAMLLAILLTANAAR